MNFRPTLDFLKKTNHDLKSYYTTGLQEAMFHHPQRPWIQNFRGSVLLCTNQPLPIESRRRHKAAKRSTGTGKVFETTGGKNMEDGRKKKTGDSTSIGKFKM